MDSMSEEYIEQFFDSQESNMQEADMDMLDFIDVDDGLDDLHDLLETQDDAETVVSTHLSDVDTNGGSTGLGEEVLIMRLPSLPSKPLHVLNTELKHAPLLSACIELPVAPMEAFSSAPIPTDIPPQSSHSLSAADPDFNVQHSARLKKLAHSMKQSEQSRTQLRKQHSMPLTGIITPAKPLPEQSSRLASFFGGKRSSLTSGLEHSRSQVRAYMAMTSNQIL